MRAFLGRRGPKPLRCDPSKLVGLSERLVRSHWENNYGGAVKALNAVEQRLATLLDEKELPPFIYADLKREGLVRTGSVILHEHDFDNLGGDGRALQALARIVRCADFRDEIAGTPEAAGLRAISRGFPLVARDDHETVKKAVFLYDTLYASLCERVAGSAERKEES